MIAQKFFYYSVAKLPNQMDKAELLDEIRAALNYEEDCRATGQGVGTKESFRRSACEVELSKKPEGVADWLEAVVND